MYLASNAMLLWRCGDSTTDGRNLPDMLAVGAIDARFTLAKAAASCMSPVDGALRTSARIVPETPMQGRSLP
jgi:hypothetical protein